MTRPAEVCWDKSRNRGRYEETISLPLDEGDAGLCELLTCAAAVERVETFSCCCSEPEEKEHGKFFCELLSTITRGILGTSTWEESPGVSRTCWMSPCCPSPLSPPTVHLTWKPLRMSCHHTASAYQRLDLMEPRMKKHSGDTGESGGGREGEMEGWREAMTETPTKHGLFLANENLDRKCGYMENDKQTSSKESSCCKDLTCSVLVDPHPHGLSGLLVMSKTHLPLCLLNHRQHSRAGE
ncbi:hypothetical protein INR49_022167, partial [Caranx melampygus]